VTKSKEQRGITFEARLNILFILIDDMGWKDMRCAGNLYYETPHIDALAESGVRFLNAYSSSPVCNPFVVRFFPAKIRRGPNLPPDSSYPFQKTG
jgi:arylsulfatase A-like enzyme